jgi:hypothetical protein
VRPEVAVDRLETDTHPRDFPGYGRSMTTKATKAPRRPEAATPWGPASVREELRVAQRAGARRFETVVQLLEDGKGGELIRFAYATGGTVRRGPVTLRPRDVERLLAALESRPRLAAALGLHAGSPPSTTE